SKRNALLTESGQPIERSLLFVEFPVGRAWNARVSQALRLRKRQKPAEKSLDQAVAKNNQPDAEREGRNGRDQSPRLLEQKAETKPKVLQEVVEPTKLHFEFAICDLRFAICDWADRTQSII